MKVNKKSLIIILSIIAVMGVLGCIRIITMRTANEIAYPIYITEDETFNQLMEKQQQELYIEHPTVFRLMAKARGLDKHLRPGLYLMQPDMKYIDLVQKLYRGQQDPIRLTIGKFRLPQDLNNYLNQKLMHDDFNVSLDEFHLILPDTYEVYWTITPAQFMQRMEKENYRFWEGMPTTVHLPPIDAVILASIVEEETNNKSEKPLIASVYLNRMEKGMPLQADPTVKYAVGDFTLRRILNKHLATESPFNTYLHAGLPPAPICLPSKETIKAVVFAPQTDFLYFCASPTLDGTHRFAATLAEHNRNAAAYHAALNRQGIKR
ncbi:MAG: endolytic transglycosylase MltG [Bacteroidales bacterium]|nr:endolytic transglycosylase MltG [Bacteroidales bacterium]